MALNRRIFLVILAVCLDRLTQSMLKTGGDRIKSRLKERGPIGYVRKFFVSADQ